MAAFVRNRPDEERDLVQKWIMEGSDASKARGKLADTSVDLPSGLRP